MENVSVFLYLPRNIPVLNKRRMPFARCAAAPASKSPAKPGLCLGFAPLLRDACPEPPLRCKGEGGIEKSFLRNFFRI